MQVPALEEVPLCKKLVPQRRPKKLPQLDERPGPRKPRPHCCRRALKAKQVSRGLFYPPPEKLAAIAEGAMEFWVEPCGSDSDDSDVSEDSYPTLEATHLRGIHRYWAPKIHKNA